MKPKSVKMPLFGSKIADFAELELRCWNYNVGMMQNW